MMNCKLIVLCILLLINLVSTSHKRGFHKNSHRVANRRRHKVTNRRQQIFGQNRGNPPVPPIGKELQNQLREQVNEDSRLVDVSPTNADALNGFTGAGIGLPFGTPNRRIDKNPLIGANGLTKNSLADIMFGNLKGLVKPNDGNQMMSYNELQSDSIQGGDMRQMVGGQMEEMNNGGTNEMGNILSNAQPMNLNALAAMNNLAGSQGLNAFGARHGALGNMMNAGNMNNENMNFGNMNGGSLTSMGINGMNPNVLGNPALGVNSFGGPLQPNPALGLQMMSQLSNMNEQQNDWSGKHHKRHHKHKKHPKKTTTKLLLKLLVDKLRDIYELDQMNAGNKKMDSSTAGKIGLTLDDLGVPKGDVHHGKENETDSTLGGFKTKLSFPVTISDSKATEELHLTDEASRKNFEGKIPTDDDDAKIQKILSGLGIKEGDGTVKKTNTNDSADSLLKDIQTATDLDTKAKAITSSFTPVIKGQEVQNENAKTRDNIEEVKMDDRGSISEFHKINMRNDNGDVVSPISGVKSDISPSEIANFRDPQQGEVTVPEIFSVSSLLNNGIVDTQESTFSKDVTEESAIHGKKLKILGIDASKKTVASGSSNKKVLPYVPSDINTDQADLKSLTDTMAHDVKTKVKDGEDYVKAARVLGAVFKKVKDPVAKQSIETAIKAMLKVMKNAAKENNNSFKKHKLPSDDDEKLVEQLQRLNGVFNKMKESMPTTSKEKRSNHIKKDKKSHIGLFNVVRHKSFQSKLNRKIT